VTAAVEDYDNMASNLIFCCTVHQQDSSCRCNWWKSRSATM